MEEELITLRQSLDREKKDRMAEVNEKEREKI